MKEKMVYYKANKRGCGRTNALLTAYDWECWRLAQYGYENFLPYIYS